jgi:AmmeMemoRadiSam system protein B/AmmeMemoRadiSam system protein A
VQRSSLAGTWYTDNAHDLRSQIRSFLDSADTTAREDVIALILPHAGYAYSGQCAAKAVKVLKKNYKRVIVLGPSHRVAMPEVLSVPRVSHYETPLGLVPLDTDLIETLLSHDQVFKSIPAAHQDEHSVQIEIPMLQVHLAPFQLVPIVVGQCSEATLTRAAEILRRVVNGDTLVVASSDFTHYGPRFDYLPFSDSVPEQLRNLDMNAFDTIKTINPKAFLAYVKKTGATICGQAGIAVLLAMLDAATQTHLIDYTTSGALTDDYTNSVSYVSACFTGHWTPGPTPKLSPATSVLSGQEQRTLLSLARKTILHYLTHQTEPLPGDLGIEITEAMAQKRAAFVTLKKRGRLRGCIGDILPRVPLYQSVINNAIHSAFHDTRFEPVTQSECHHLTLGISALTVPSPVASFQEIRIGTDGVILRKGARSAVFLPQVAPEQGWDITQTLTHLSLKAGLPAHAWQEDAEFLVFQADVFSENPGEKDPA